MAFSLTKREHSIGNSTTALLLDDMGIMFDCLLGWLLKWSCSNEKAMLVSLSVPLFVVGFLSQTMFSLEMLYVG